MAGTFERRASPGFALGFDSGVTDNLCKDQGSCGKTEIAVSSLRYGSRPGGAPAWNGSDTGSRGAVLVHVPHAVMSTIASAAGRQTGCNSSGVESKRRRDQRDAEEQQQHDAEEATHTAIVAESAVCEENWALMESQSCDGWTPHAHATSIATRSSGR